MDRSVGFLDAIELGRAAWVRLFSHRLAMDPLPILGDDGEHDDERDPGNRRKSFIRQNNVTRSRTWRLPRFDSGEPVEIVVGAVLMVKMSLRRHLPFHLRQGDRLCRRPPLLPTASRRRSVFDIFRKSGGLRLIHARLLSPLRRRSLT
jgi:hypothetical protein